MIPKYIVTDQEKAPINAIQNIFPKTNVYYCLTHYSNSIYKMLMKHTLANKYSSDRKFNQIVNILKSIVFVDPQKIHSLICKIEHEIASYSDFVISNLFQNFLTQFFIYENEEY
jgi:hypothetical protein